MVLSPVTWRHTEGYPTSPVRTSADRASRLTDDLGLVPGQQLRLQRELAGMWSERSRQIDQRIERRRHEKTNFYLENPNARGRGCRSMALT
jgi:hypothetical protein